MHVLLCEPKSNFHAQNSRIRAVLHFQSLPSAKSDPKTKIETGGDQNPWLELGVKIGQAGFSIYLAQVQADFFYVGKSKPEQGLD